MKLSEILQLDCRTKQGRLELKVALKEKISFLESTELEEIEKAVKKICMKYPVRLAYIMPGPLKEPFYAFMIKRDDTDEWIKTVYSVSMHEGFAKTLIFLYAYIKKNGLEKRVEK